MMSQFPYAVVVCDLDGTLLGADSRPSARTKQTIQQLSAMGVHIGFATGRHHCDASIILNKFQLPHPGFLITSNGSRVDVIEGTASSNVVAKGEGNLELVFEHRLDTDIVCELLQFLSADEQEVNVNLFLSDEWKSALDWPDQLEYFKESGFRYTLMNPLELAHQYQLYQEKLKQGNTSDAGPHTTDCQNPLSGVVNMAFSSENTQRLRALEERILERYQERVKVAFSSLFCLDVCGKGVTKGSALEQLLPRLQSHDAPLSLKNCIAFGDGMNDADLLSVVGKGCIMGNAQPRLKEALPHLEVIASNVEDGVAKKLSDIFGLPD